MKQTAVEWLEEHIKKVNWIDKKLSERMDIIKQAKEMEQKNIENAFEQGMSHHTNGLFPNEYYNETYETKKD